MCPCLRCNPGLYVQPFEPYANVLLVVTPVGVASTAQSSMDLIWHSCSPSSRVCAELPNGVWSLYGVEGQHTMAALDGW
jgi:hypothetical protein